MNKAAVFCLFLSATAGTALAQDTITTVSAGIGLGRANLKLVLGPPLGTLESTTDVFSASFTKSVVTNFTPTDTSGIITIGKCIVLPFTPPAGPNATITSTFLNAGPVMNLTGPSGTKQIPITRNVFSASLGGGAAFPGAPAPAPLYLVAGMYTVDNGGGGADIGPFSVSLTLPDPFVWTNPDDLTSIDRSGSIDVTWSGGDPNSKVQIGGAVLIMDPVTHQQTGGASFACEEDDSAGHFTVGPDVLSLLPASTTTNGVSNGGMVLINGVATKFDLAGVDQANFVFNSIVSRSVEYK